MKSILYVSKARLNAAIAEDEVKQIVSVARNRNTVSGVTGMLVFTGDHFAQVLEGPDEAVDLLMGTIRSDPRHQSLREYAQPIAERSFTAWSLGYKGESTYVDRRVRALYGRAPGTELDGAHAELRELMLLLAHQA